MNHMAVLPSATVVICTHNPRRDLLTRVLSALRAQTLPCSDWELLVVDNNSAERVAGWVDVSWHLHSRILHEPRPGKTFALKQGQAEARSDLLVIVDDDNLLVPTYLADAVRIASDHPFLGAWGGGSVGEYEAPLPRWLELAEESQISSFLLREIRQRPYPPYFSGSMLKRVATWVRLWSLPRMDRRIRQALVRGQRKGRLMAAELLAKPPVEGGTAGQS